MKPLIRQLMPYLIVLAVFAMLLAITSAVYAEGTVGFNYSRAVDDTALGITGDYETELGVSILNLEGQLQNGDLYVGNVDASIQFDVSAIGIKLSSLNKLQGHTLAEIGRQNTLDLALVVPINDVDLAIGVFGQNGNPFAPQYELTDAADPESEVIESEAGINIPEGNRWGISAAAGLDISAFEVDIKALLDPNNITHQGRIGIGTGGNLRGQLGWTANMNIALQSHEDIVEYQTDTFIGINYKF